MTGDDPGPSVEVMISTFLSRRATAAYLFSGAVLSAVGFAVTPWEDEQTTRSYLDALAANPTQAQISALLLHLGYLLLVAGGFGILATLGRSGGLAMRIGGVLTVVGATTMPGLLMTDAYDMAIATELPRDVGVRVSDAAGELAMSSVILITAMLGFIIGGALLVIALWRAGKVPGVVPILVLLGWVVPMIAWSVPLTLTGGALLVIAYTIVAVRLWDPESEEAADAADEQETSTPAHEPIDPRAVAPSA